MNRIKAVYRRRRRWASLTLMAMAVTGVLLFGCANEKEAEPVAKKRPANWAQPIEKSGLPNLHKVSDKLYRGAQPTAEGMKELEKMGIKTVLNLRSFHSDRDELEGTNLGYEHLYMKAWHPEDKELIHFLKMVTDEEKTPIFVHCQHGADRTGTICATYRIIIEGWEVEDAITEMREGGYGFHEVWANLPPYLRELDLDELRKEAGIEPPKESEEQEDPDK